MKHFNLGNVWGRVVSVKEEQSRGNGTPYLQIQVECPNELSGNVKTYGRLWGRQKIDAFLDYYKKHPGEVFRFRGFFSQYNNEKGHRFSNYTFFEWTTSKTMEFRAAFVLVGEVTDKEEVRGEGRLYIHIVREGQGDYKDVEEDFVVYAPEAKEFDGIEIGQIVEAKGVLRPKEPEDYFGMPGSRIKPYLKELRVRTELAEETVSEPF